MSFYLKTILIGFFIMLHMSSILAQITSQTYQSAIESADKFYIEKDYLSAKTYYEIALRIQNNDPYASKRLSETISQLKKQMESRELYYENIDKADKLLRDGKTEQALKAYKEALVFVPADKYAINQIEQLEKQLLVEKEKLNQFSVFVERGNFLAKENKLEESIFQFTEAEKLYPTHPAVAEKLPLLRSKLKEQLDNEKQFSDFLQQYEAAITRKDYDKSIAAIRSALSVFPDDVNAQANLIYAARLKKNVEDYNESLEKADELYASKDFRKAAVFYEKASAIMPDQAYPADMLKRIDEITSDKTFVDEKAYADAVAMADKKFGDKAYSAAKDEYLYALKIKPGDDYAMKRLSESNNQIELLKNSENIEKQFKQLLEAGTSAVAELNWEQAVTAFSSALELKPNDIGVSNKLRQAEIELSNQRRFLDQNKAFSDLLVSAEMHMNNEAYSLAVGDLEKALIIKPSDQQTTTKLDLAKSKLAEVTQKSANEQLFALKLENSRKEYDAENWNEALKLINEALLIKPSDSVAIVHMRSVQGKIDESQRNKEIRSNYDALVAKADKLVGSDEADEALKLYEEALKLLPSEMHPRNQIEKIKQQKMLAEALKNKEQKLTELNSVALQYLTKEEILLADSILREMNSIDSQHVLTISTTTEINRKKSEIGLRNNQRYADAVALADRLFESRDYREAVVAYKTARSFKPQDNYANDRIVLAENIMREQLQKQKTEYDKVVSEADKFFIAKAYDKAVEQFAKASEIKPDETYPSEMIERITKIIEENKLFELNLNPMLLATNTDHRFDFEPVPVNERRTNYILVKAKNTGSQNFSLIVSYGSRNGRNGGFVLPIPASNEYKDYIVRIGSQYKWFSEDNNWINFYPENGAVEVGLIQISKGN